MASRSTSTLEGTQAPARPGIAQLAARLAAVLGTWAALCLVADVAIPVEPLGVPITLQSLLVVASAMLFGPRLSLAGIGLYVITGALGARVFAEGEAGWAVLIGQTGGYILGFLLVPHAVALVLKGGLRGKPNYTLLRVAAAATLGTVVIFAVGVPWLKVVHSLPRDAHMTWATAIRGGLTPFIPGAIAKTLIAVAAGMLAGKATTRLW